MPFQKFSSGSPFSILVPALTGQYDSKGNPIKGKQKVTMQITLDEKGLASNCLVPESQKATGIGTITVANNTFTAGTTLFIGDSQIICGEHFVAGVDEEATATNIATVIDRIPNFSATSLVDVITVTYEGVLDSTLPFYATYKGSVANFTISPSFRSLILDPYLQPPKFE